MEKNFKELTPEELRRICNPDDLGFETTDEVTKGPHKVISQERVSPAILFGVGMDGLDYNIYVAGPQKAGMTHITKTLIEEISREQKPPTDWCYINNFERTGPPEGPVIAHGKGKELKKDMGEAGDIRNDIPDVFESEDYAQKRSLKTVQIQRG